MDYFGNNIAFKIDCAACGSKTILKTDVYGLPMDPLVALYSAVPSQVGYRGFQIRLNIYFFLAVHRDTRTATDTL